MIWHESCSLRRVGYDRPVQGSYGGWVRYVGLIACLTEVGLSLRKDLLMRRQEKGWSMNAEICMQAHLIYEFQQAREIEVISSVG